MATAKQSLYQDDTSQVLSCVWIKAFYDMWVIATKKYTISIKRNYTQSKEENELKDLLLASC